MKLKLVVASMSVLGLVSCPVFAATTMTKHKHHHKMMKEHAVSEYKGAELAPAPEVCTISETSMIMDQTTQSIGRSMPNACNAGWFNRVQVSGGINVDLGKFGNRNGSYMGENYQRFSLNDAYLNIGATINDWAKAFASLSYSTPTTVADDFSFSTGEYSAAYANNIQSDGQNNVQLEQAYATLGNFDESPVYIQVGKQFQDFSRYEIHPITRSMTQVLSETLATSGKLGFILPMGFSGGIFAFDDPTAKVGQTARPTNYGVSLGIDQPSDALGWDLGAAYLYNMLGVNDVAYAVQNFTHNAGYNTRASGLALYGDINSGPFILNGRYTTALQRFNPNDIPENGIADVTGTTVNPAASGAKPWAAGIQAGYGFEGWGRDQNVYLGYQTSRQAAGIDLPKSRWLVGYGVNAFGKNTNIGIEWDHDQAYSTSDGGGSSNNTNLVSVRTAVKFG